MYAKLTIGFRLDGYAWWRRKTISGFAFVVVDVLQNSSLDWGFSLSW